MEKENKGRYTPAQKEAIGKYMQTRDTFKLYFPAGSKERIKSRAEILNMSINEYMRSLVADDLNDDSLR